MTGLGTSAAAPGAGDDHPAAAAPALPSGLQARLAEVPGLAWTVSRAFAAIRPASPSWPAPLRLLSALWSVPTFLVLYLPGVFLEVWSRHLVRRDRHAVLVVRPVGVGLGPVKLAVAFLWLVALTLPVVVFAPVPVLVALGVPLVTDIAATLVAAARHGGPGAGARARLLASQGHLVRAVGLYAANPRGQGHGSALLELLIAQAPAGLWLLTSARDEGLAELYCSRYGFRVWDPARPLMLERPPASG